MGVGGGGWGVMCGEFWPKLIFLRNISKRIVLFVANNLTHMLTRNKTLFFVCFLLGRRLR